MYSIGDRMGAKVRLFSWVNGYIPVALVQCHSTLPPRCMYPDDALCKYKVLLMSLTVEMITCRPDPREDHPFMIHNRTEHHHPGETARHEFQTYEAFQPPLPRKQKQ